MSGFRHPAKVAPAASSGRDAAGGGHRAGGGDVGAGRFDDEDFEAEDKARRQQEGKPARAGRSISLKARAVAYLSRREHSRAELTRKLAPHAESEEALQAVLDALVREGWQSDERYAQELVHRKAGRQGAARIVHELRQQGIGDAQITDIRDELRATEFDRARAVWQKRFGQPPRDRNDYARQARFLAARGFSGEIARKVLGSAEDDDWGSDEG